MSMNTGNRVEKCTVLEGGHLGRYFSKSRWEEMKKAGGGRSRSVGRDKNE